MKTLKYNFTIPEDIAMRLNEVTGARGRSAFVAAAIGEKLKQIEREQLNQRLIEGYIARRDEDAQINEEWERATLEGWV